MTTGVAEKHVDPCVEIKEISRWVNGNGVTGAKTRLALLENNMKDIKEMLLWIRNALVGLFITITGGIILFFFLQVIPHVNGG